MSLYVSGILAGMVGVLSVTQAMAEPGSPISKTPKQVAPGHRPDPSYSGVVIDTTKPAYVPLFAQPQPVIALQNERDRALRLDPPVGFLLPWGYIGSVYIPWYDGCP